MDLTKSQLTQNYWECAAYKARTGPREVQWKQLLNSQGRWWYVCGGCLCVSMATEEGAPFCSEFVSNPSALWVRRSVWTRVPESHEVCCRERSTNICNRINSPVDHL